jgi:hypothetical protein
VVIGHGRAWAGPDRVGLLPDFSGFIRHGGLLADLHTRPNAEGATVVNTNAALAVYFSFLD